MYVYICVYILYVHVFSIYYLYACRYVCVCMICSVSCVVLYTLITYMCSTALHPVSFKLGKVGIKHFINLDTIFLCHIIITFYVDDLCKN